MGEPIRSFAEEAGLVMRRPPKTSYTMPALEATEYAYQEGRFYAFHHAAYKAFWEYGKDLEDISVLKEVADESGLDSNGLEQCLREERYRGVVKEQYQDALSKGVDGIPSFLLGKLFFSGAEHYDIFRRIMEMALQRG